MRQSTIHAILVMTLLTAILPLNPKLFAEETKIDVRVRSQGAMFVGTSMGGARVLIRDAETGELLADGVTAGSTGDRERIMKQEHAIGDSLSTPDAAVFRGSVDIDQPTRIRVEAFGPLSQPQAIQKVTSTQWLIPGKHIVKGDGLTLILPGFVVDILSPPAHLKLSGTPQKIKITANVTLMCGCPVEPDGMWDSDQYEIEMILKRDGKTVKTQPLKYAGETSQFQGEVTVTQPGAYEITVYAYDPENGNVGLDKTTFIVAN